MKVVSGQWSVVSDERARSGNVRFAYNALQPQREHPTTISRKGAKTQSNSSVCQPQRIHNISNSFAPLRLCVNPVSRRGLTLLEVLVSLFVLSFGLLGVAALIPLAKLSMARTEQSDRVGACGRAAIHEVKIRRMLDPNTWGTWSTAPVVTDRALVIDPMERTLTTPIGNLGGTTGAIKRGNLAWCTSAAIAEQVFRWQDDLTFVLPEDDKSATPPPAGTRPYQRVAGTQDFVGNYSWFFMISPSPADVANGVPWVNRSTFDVSAVVCRQRLFSVTGTTPDGEREITGATCTGSIGGAGITIAGDATNGGTITGDTVTTGIHAPLKHGEWVLLYSTLAGHEQYNWYRVAYVGYDGTNTQATLTGPDWNGGATANIVIVAGACGVYTGSVQLDSDAIWSK